MAVHAYVFVDCVRSTPHEVAKALRTLPGVKAAHAVTGMYDVVAFLQAECMAALADLLSGHIQRLPGIAATATTVVVKPAAARRDTAPVARAGRLGTCTDVRL